MMQVKNSTCIILDQAQRLAAAVKARPELELVCFRHLVSDRASKEERNQFNLALLKKLVSRGNIYLSNAELKEKFCLRACIVNHLTQDADIDAVVPEVMAAALEVVE
jgi:aromatic-L-amino-acid/L-tryptophan decarboxylase